MCRSVHAEQCNVLGELARKIFKKLTKLTVIKSFIDINSGLCYYFC